jgi:hypothetical protein
MLDVGQLDLPAADRAIVQSFVAAWREHSPPVLFVGSGLSKMAVRKPSAPLGAAFRDWSELTKILADELANGDPALASRVPKNDLRVAELHEAQHLRATLLDRVQAAVPMEHFDPGEVHRRLSRLPWAAVVTTNYDDLVERAFHRRTIRKIIWDPDITQRREPDDLLVIKMHGDLRDRGSIVLTEEDYRQYAGQRPGISLKVKQLLLEHPVLFVGFSLTDPNVINIDGWIRDTLGAARLPWIALVRPPVLPAEHVMWHRRGVHVIAVDDLARVVEALQGETLRTGRSVRADNVRDQIANIVKTRAEGWQKRVADLCIAAPEDEFTWVIRFALNGRFLDLSANDVRGVVRALEGSDRRTLLIRAYEAGMTDARGLAGPTTGDADVSSRPDEQVLNIETELLNDTKLSRAERARVLFQRARLSRLRGENDRARKDLEDAKPLADGRELLRRIDLEIGELVNASDDADEVRRRLATPPVDGDAFACCRRGSDALVLGDIKLASQWYDEAEKHAVNGDEDTAALMGLSACVNWREDAPRTTELDERRRAIPAATRPRTERVFERAETARGRLLDRGREVAIQEYRKAIDEANSMGWPRSARLSTVTLLDHYVESTNRLLLDREASFDEAKEA